MVEPIRISLPTSLGAVSCLTWGNEGRQLHFAHATGFNAETYRALLTPLSDSFRIVASDLRGHGSSTLSTEPGASEGWKIYRDDLLAVIATLRGPVVLVGHSLGATVSLMAAAKCPKLVLGLILLEPVLYPFSERMRYLLRTLRGATPNNHIWARRAEQRRSSFASFEEVLTAYANRAAFKSWEIETLIDYLNGGLVADLPGQGVRLACKTLWEAEIYRGMPFGVARLARRLRCPISLVYGSIESTCYESQARLLGRLGARVIKVQGASHFLPMEFPELVRAEIARYVE